MTEYDDFVKNTLTQLRTLPSDGPALEKSLQYEGIKRFGTWVEFGVATGSTLTSIVKNRGIATVWGFDTFSGLPEDWIPGYPKGTFAQAAIPIIPDAHIVTGLFQDTLPAWHPTEPVTFAHIDCDIYSAAKCAMTHICPMLVDGSIIVFDEIFNYSGFENHELLALFEMANAGLRYDWLFSGAWPRDCAAALIVRKHS